MLREIMDALGEALREFFHLASIVFAAAVGAAFALVLLFFMIRYIVRYYKSKKS